MPWPFRFRHCPGHLPRYLELKPLRPTWAIFWNMSTLKNGLPSKNLKVWLTTEVMVGPNMYHPGSPSGLSCEWFWAREKTMIVGKGLWRFINIFEGLDVQYGFWIQVSCMQQSWDFYFNELPCPRLSFVQEVFLLFDPLKSIYVGGSTCLASGSMEYSWNHPYHPCMVYLLGGGFKYFLFLPLLVEMIQSD